MKTREELGCDPRPRDGIDPIPNQGNFSVQRG